MNEGIVGWVHAGPEYTKHVEFVPEAWSREKAEMHARLEDRCLLVAEARSMQMSDVSS